MASYDTLLYYVTYLYVCYKNIWTTLRCKLINFIILIQFFKKNKKDTQDSIAKANDTANEVLSGIRTVKSFAAESFEILRFAKLLDVTLTLGRTRAKLLMWDLIIEEVFKTFDFKKLVSSIIYVYYCIILWWHFGYKRSGKNIYYLLIHII